MCACTALPPGAWSCPLLVLCRYLSLGGHGPVGLATAACGHCTGQMGFPAICSCGYLCMGSFVSSRTSRAHKGQALARPLWTMKHFCLSCGDQGDLPPSVECASERRRVALRFCLQCSDSHLLSSRWSARAMTSLEK